MGYLLTWAPYV